MAEAQQFCTFFLDGHYFGVEVEKVQEVRMYQELTPVPLAPPVLKGLINLRGQIVSAIDLRCRLEFPERDNSELPMNVVVRTEDGVVALLVDEIGDVLEFKEESFEPLPETLGGVARDLVTGVYKLKDSLMLILDTEKAIHVVASNGRNHEKRKQ
ncbi:MAG: purine-binding chemotaxis protein CheW [Acidobacteria bacterium]|nr:purine-binding chemotaxis protein CheW [Acidobacteriota bacterium]